MGRKKLSKAKQKELRREAAVVKRYKKTSLPASFTSPHKLAGVINDKAENIEKYLKREPAYYLHRKAALKYPRRKVIVSGPFEQLQIDLKDVARYASENDGTRFLLCAIDAFSKMAYVRPMLNKTAEESEKALLSILNSMKEPVSSIQADRGSEFFNAKYKKLLGKKNIKLFSSYEPTIKAQIVERFQRHLMKRIHRYFTAFNTFRYIDDLADIVDSYNSTIHSSTGLAPNEVSYKNAEKVWNNLYEKDSKARGKKHFSKPVIYKFEEGDTVLISKNKGLFQKEYLGSWKPEIFVIKKRLITTPPTYKIADWCGEILEGGFYEPELQRVTPPKTYEVEKVVDTRKRKGKTEYLVKFRYYPDCANEWVKNFTYM